MTRLAVIVVSYRQRELLRSCLASIEAALARLDVGGQCVVVDNGSDDGSAEMVVEDFPEVTLVALGENHGFAGGVCAGIRRTDADWIALLNNDTTVDCEGLSELLRVGESDARIGSVAAQMRFADRPETINSAGLVVDRLGVASDRLLGAPVEASEERPVDVFGASAGAALYRRDMLADVGGFDESFFAYLEDVDVAWRARMRGWRCLYAPRAVVHHRHSATSGHASPFKYFLVGRNRVRLLAKNADRRHLRRYGGAIVAYDVAYVLFAAIADRTVAPLRGRVRGLREWRAFRAAGAQGRRPIELAPVQGLRRALRRRGSWPS